MNGRSHLFIGLSVGVALAAASAAPPLVVAGIVAAAATGSLLPDVDHRNAKINRYTPPGAGTLTQAIIGHRTWTHSFWFVALLSLLVLLPIERWLVVALIAGVLSHIAADAMTARGIKLFYPWLWVRVPVIWRVVGWLGL
jgi:inner membrane protein